MLFCVLKLIADFYLDRNISRSYRELWSSYILAVLSCRILWFLGCQQCIFLVHLRIVCRLRIIFWILQLYDEVFFAEKKKIFTSLQCSPFAVGRCRKLFFVKERLMLNIVSSAYSYMYLYDIEISLILMMENSGCYWCISVHAEFHLSIVCSASCSGAKRGSLVTASWSRIDAPVIWWCCQKFFWRWINTNCHSRWKTETLICGPNDSTFSNGSLLANKAMDRSLIGGLLENSWWRFESLACRDASINLP